MIRVNIDEIVSKLKNEFNFWNKKWFFWKWSHKIDYKTLEKLVFWKINIQWNEVKFLWEKWEDFLDNYIWIYELKDNTEIGKIIILLKNRFIEEILKQISFCPFCWKVPLIKFEKLRIFDLDHIFPKSKKETDTITVYPHLAINLYNLIPCCKWCNFIKSNKNFFDEGKDIFHPYFGFINKNWTIGFINKNWNINDDKQTLDTKYSFTKENKKTNIFGSEHSKFFNLWQIYLNSQDTFNEFLFIQDKFTKIKDEKMRFKKDFKTDEDYKNYFFKNYYPEKEEDILKYSNWKFKKDLIKSIIKI